MYQTNTGASDPMGYLDCPMTTNLWIHANLGYSCCRTMLCPPDRPGVFIRWTGMDHWTAGMDYWNGLLDYWNGLLEHACHKFEVSLTIVHMHACMHTAKKERLFQQWISCWHYHLMLHSICNNVLLIVIPYMAIIVWI